MIPLFGQRTTDCKEWALFTCSSELCPCVDQIPSYFKVAIIRGSDFGWEFRILKCFATDSLWSCGRGQCPFKQCLNFSSRKPTGMWWAYPRVWGTRVRASPCQYWYGKVRVQPWSLFNPSPEGVVHWYPKLDNSITKRGSVPRLVFLFFGFFQNVIWIVCFWPFTPDMSADIFQPPLKKICQDVGPDSPLRHVEWSSLSYQVQTFAVFNSKTWKTISNFRR